MRCGFLLAFILLVFASCIRREDAPTTDFKKDGTVEIIFETIHLADTADLLITKKRVYKNGQMLREINTYDTLPNLGNTTKTAENEDGHQMQVVVPREYEMFVTIK